MKKIITAAVIVCLLCICIFITGCGEPDSGTGSVTSIKLRYNGSAISNNTLTANLSAGTLTFTADVQVTGKASKDFTLGSSNTGVAGVSGKTLTLNSGGQTIITAVAAGDSDKKHSITLIVLDDNIYSIIVAGGSADIASALSGQTVTLTPGTQAGKEFSDWTIDPPDVVMISPNQFKMPSSDVVVTGNFSGISTGLVPYFITNMFAQDSSTGLLVQWHNEISVDTQTLQIVAASGSFNNAREITVTGETWNPTRTAGTDVGNYAPRNIFRTEVSGLSPAALYKYRVGDTGSWSKTFTHLTAGGSNTDFSFTVITDPQNATFDDMLATMNAANDFDEDNRFFINCGDIVNDIGVQPGEIYNYTNSANEINIHKPIAMTQGNHDTYYNVGGDTYVFGNAEVFNKFAIFPLNGWHSTDTYNSPNRSKSYYFYYNKVLVIMLNTMATANPTGTGSPDHSKQTAWLEEILNTDRIQGWSKYKIIATHVSPFGGRSHERWLQAEVRAAYGPICTKYGVDIFFAGHDHIYGRSNPLIITGTDAANTSLEEVFNENIGADNIFGPTPGGTIYSIAGSTGPKFYSVEDATWVSRYFPVNKSQVDMTPGMYVNVKVTGDRLIVTAKKTGASGELDRYEVAVK